MPPRSPFPVPPFLSLAFRPFFLAAALWSAVALGLWIVMLSGGPIPPMRLDPLTWHIHEMLFGFVPAAIAGFLLTAIPNWTGRPPVRGAALMGLLLLWAAGRAAGLIGALLPLWLEATIDMAFPALLCAVAAREIMLAGNRRNLPIPLPVALLAIADLLTVLEAAGHDVPTGLGWRLGLAAILVLISVIGGRIIPAFTRNWLMRRGDDRLPPPHGMIDSAAIALLIAVLAAWIVLPGSRAVGVALILGAAVNLLRLARWRGHATGAEPLLAVLHLGYLWVPVGGVLLGLSLLTPLVPKAAAVHAWTAGAIGTMIIAVMTRVSLGHTGRPLTADRLTTMIYAMIALAALARIAAAFTMSAATGLLNISAGLWIAGFLLFAARYGRFLLGPRLT